MHKGSAAVPLTTIFAGFTTGADLLVCKCLPGGSGGDDGDDDGDDVPQVTMTPLPHYYQLSNHCLSPSRS